jgi:hypothetical protein
MTFVSWNNNLAVLIDVLSLFWYVAILKIPKMSLFWSSPEWPYHSFRKVQCSTKWQYTFNTFLIQQIKSSLIIHVPWKCLFIKIYNVYVFTRTSCIFVIGRARYAIKFHIFFLDYLTITILSLLFRIGRNNRQSSANSLTSHSVDSGRSLMNSKKSKS